MKLSRLAIRAILDADINSRTLLEFEERLSNIDLLIDPTDQSQSTLTVIAKDSNMSWIDIFAREE